MKKNKIFKNVICITLASSFLFSNAAYAFNGVKKDESVYITLSSNGKHKETIVSNWLHSDTSNIEIKDKSTLTSIKNVKGDEVPAIDGQNVTWKPEENDIFYQGNTDKPIPIESIITYYMDGKEIEPSELAGKSGRVKINIKLINKDSHKATINGKNRTLYTPFMAVVVVNLPIDTFKNVSSTEGEVLSDGNNQIVTFISLPGMQDSLGIDEKVIKLPDEVTIEADAKNFKIGPIMISASPSLPDSGKFEKARNINELFDGLDSLENSASKLCDGTGAISDATAYMSKNIEKFSTGIKALDSASYKINNGALELSKGTAASLDGAKGLAYGISNLNNGVCDFGKGAENFSNGAMLFAENSQKFANGAEKVTNGVGSISSGTDKLSNSLNQIVNSTEELKKGQEQVVKGANSSLKAISKIKSGKEKELKAIDILINGIDGLKKIAELIENIPGTKDLTQKLISGLDDQKSGLMQLHESGNELLSGLTELEKGLEDIKTGSEKLNSGIGELQKGQIAARDGAAALNEGAKALAPAVKELNTGSYGLMEGSKGLIGGAAELNKGASAISTGSDKLEFGANSLVEGMTALKRGEENLATGTSEFSNNMHKASSAASSLDEGAKKISSGCNELNVNMNKFNNEGVKKLSDKLSGEIENIDDILASKDELVKLSKDYNSFSGIGEDMKGSVKFIMKTDEIKLPEVKTNDVVVIKKESKGFLSWIKNLFK